MNIETFERKRDNFEKQFMAPTMIPLDKGNIPVYVLEKENARDKNFMFFAPGWAMKVEDMYKDNALKAMYEDRKIFTFDPPAKGAEFKLSADEQKTIEGHDFPPEEIRMAKTLIYVIENLKMSGKIGVEPIDVAAHSRGLGYSTIAAMLRPDLFRTLGAYGGAGLIGKDNVPSLLWRTLVGQQHFRWWNPVEWGAESTDMEKLSKEVARERKKEGKSRFMSLFTRVSTEEVAAVHEELEGKKKAAAERGIEEYAAPTDEQKKIMDGVAGKAMGVTIKYLLGAPGRRVHEIGGLADIRIDRALLELAQKRGINIVLAYGDSDPLFSKGRQNEYTMSKEFQDAGILLVSINGTHGTFGERSVIPHILTGAISVMNEQRKRKSSLMGRLNSETPDKTTDGTTA